MKQAPTRAEVSIGAISIVKGKCHDSNTTTGYRRNPWSQLSIYSTKRTATRVRMRSFSKVKLILKVCIPLCTCFSWFHWSLAGNSARLTWVRLQQPQEQRCPLLTVRAGFSCVQTEVWLPMLGIFNVRTYVKACDCNEGCTDTGKESVLKVDSGRKLPCRTGESNLLQRRAGSTLYQLSYIPARRRNVHTEPVIMRPWRHKARQWSLWSPSEFWTHAKVS